MRFRKDDWESHWTSGIQPRNGLRVSCALVGGGTCHSRPWFPHVSRIFTSTRPVRLPGRVASQSLDCRNAECRRKQSTAVGSRRALVPLVSRACIWLLPPDPLGDAAFTNGEIEVPFLMGLGEIEATPALHSVHSHNSVRLAYDVVISVEKCNSREAR
jgi:hypothetical protein